LAWLLLAAGGCAGVAREGGAATWRFPERYDANQIVAVQLGEDHRELVASVRRTGKDVDVVLFDPALAVPLLEARQRGGDATETRHVDAIPPGYGKRLVGVLSALHALDFAIRADGAAEAGARGLRFRLEDLSGDGACRFPRTIDVAPRAIGPSIRVETIDVTCGATPRTAP
jgi:hypothetical protein